MRIFPFITLLTLVLAFSACNKKGTVIRVIDGDTILIRPYQAIRICGIDAPELDPHSQKFAHDVAHWKTNPEAEEKYALKAKKRLESLVLNKKIKLIETLSQREIFDRNRHGRDIRHIKCAEGNVAEILLTEGLARTWDNTFPPNKYPHQYELQYQSLATFAKDNQIGIWSSISLNPSAAESNENATDNPENTPE